MKLSLSYKFGIVNHYCCCCYCCYYVADYHRLNHYQNGYDNSKFYTITTTIAIAKRFQNY